MRATATTRARLRDRLIIGGGSDARVRGEVP
jgi:hypothetical protein